MACQTSNKHCLIFPDLQPPYSPNLNLRKLHLWDIIQQPLYQYHVDNVDQLESHQSCVVFTCN